jgi:elongation factor P
MPSSLRHVLITALLTTTTAFIAPTHTKHPSSLSMVAVDTSDIKNGLTIELDGEPYKVMGFSIMKQARGAAKTTIKFKNLKRGTTIENTYRSGEKFETAEITRKPSQFTYEDEVCDSCSVMLCYCC